MPAWARDIHNQCESYKVPFLMKQMTGGESVPIPHDLRAGRYRLEEIGRSSEEIAKVG